MTFGTWYLVEQLDQNEPATVVWRGDKVSDWVSLDRATKKAEGVNLTQLVDHAMKTPLASFDSRETAALMDLTTTVRGKPRRLIVHQVAGPDGTTVYGLQVWVGPTDIEPPLRPRAAGVQWDPQTGQIFNSPDTFMLSAANLDHYLNIRDVDQFFTRTFRFVDLERLVYLCTSPDVRPGATLTSNVTLYHDDGHLVNLCFVAKRCTSDVRGIAVDVTQWAKPTLDPATAMRITGSTPEGNSSALVSFRGDAPSAVPAIAYWATDPPDWVTYWHQLGPVDRQAKELIHPDDYGDLRSARNRIDAGEEAVECAVRLLGQEEWRPTRTLLSAYPGVNGPQRTLYVMQILREIT